MENFGLSQAACGALCVCCAGKRQLLRNSKDMLKLCVPLMLWGVIVIVVYGSSMQQLEQVCAQPRMSHRSLHNCQPGT